MKNTLPVLSICLLCWTLMGFKSSASARSSLKNITFHQVDLVCSAASDIGCGSRSKPILLDLEKEESIKEAWLNRAGTMVAVNWSVEAAPASDLVATVFSKHGKSMETLKGGSHDRQLILFRTEKWYQGREVDQLSKEEANKIARKVMEQIQASTILSPIDATKMEAEIEAFISNEFQSLKEVHLLDTNSYYDNWESAIEKIGEQYFGTGKMPKIELCSSASPSCTPQKKVSCCSKNSADQNCKPIKTDLKNDQ